MSVSILAVDDEERRRRASEYEASVPQGVGRPALRPGHATGMSSLGVL
jgi:hypothetical protein